MTGTQANLHPTEPEAASPWWAALTMAERLPAPAPQSGQRPAGRAGQRAARWREQTAFLDDAAYAAYFSACEVDANALALLLAEPTGDLAARGTPPAWFDDLAGVMRLLGDERTIDGIDGFLLLAEPFLLWAVDRTRARLAPLLASSSTLPFAPALADSTMLATLAGQLAPMVERTLVLEMHVARMQGDLSGDTPEARFAAFAARLRRPAVRRALLAEYPVLARQLLARARQSSDALAELLERLAADWPGLVATFFPNADPGPLSAVAFGEGDTHAGGRTVAILTFAGGARIVYKPRSLRVDALFQRLLNWLNERGADPAYRLLRVLERDGYGWVEFVERAPCATAAEVDRFYTRQGGYLALLYALYAGDFHFENLLAAGEHPMLIDLEALFHPNLLDYDEGRPDHLAQQAIDDSVLSVSMLPQRLNFAGGAAIDISGMGAGGRQMTPDKLPVWEGAGTDEMRLRRRQMEFVTEGHRPTLGGETVDVTSQGEAVARGFTLVYTLLRAHRDELLAPDGLLAEFAEAEVRIVARATRLYSLLLQENSHPDLLRDALERDRFYARLWREVERTPRLARLVAAEVRDLHDGDVPIFHARPGQPHLWDSRGELVPDFLPHSGLERVTARIRSLDDNDLARQLWYIRASFATTSRGDTHATGQSSRGSVQEPEPPYSTADFLAAARAIGDRLAQTAHRSNGHAVWIGLGLDGGDSWALNPLTMHLYDGHAGVALFLAYLGAATGERGYTALAQETLATLRVQVAQQRATFFYPGGFNGWGGIAYLLAHLGSLWHDPALWDEAADLAALAAARLEQDKQFDIIGGAAGYIGAVAALWRCRPDDKLVTLIAQAADHLLAHAQPQAQGIGWIVPEMGGRALAGFSHGASGIAWALALAANLTGDGRYRDAAHASLQYERTLYGAAAQNWRDLRGADDGDDIFMWAWCHGAPGVGLARLGLRPLLDDPALGGELTAALESTRAHGFGGGHSLCHGDFGNLELFVAAAEALQQPALLDQARHVASALLAGQAQSGWRCGVPGGVETPGLMVGIAGIGYALLRLASPSLTPSVLQMAPPRCAAG